MESLRLLLADDHELVRKGMRTILEAQPGWNVAAEANDGRQAVEKAKEVRPEIAVLDISMPVLNGLEAARQIAKTDLRTKIASLAGKSQDIHAKLGFAPTDPLPIVQAAISPRTAWGGCRAEPCRQSFRTNPLRRDD